MEDGQRIGAECSRSLRRFIWRANHTGIIYLPTVPHILHTLLLLPPSFCDKTHDAKASDKKKKTGGVGGESENVPTQDRKRPPCLGA